MSQLKFIGELIFDFQFFANSDHAENISFSCYPREPVVLKNLKFSFRDIVRIDMKPLDMIMISV